MKTPRQDPTAREERLARALRANLARRKAQARARAAQDDGTCDQPPPDDNETGET